MKICLDECLPRKLKREITGHEVFTTAEMGWSGKSNGELLALVEKEFQVFVTADRNLAFQQNLKSVKIVIAVLHAKSNRFVDLKPLVPALLSQISGPSTSPGILHIR